MYKHDAVEHYNAVEHKPTGGQDHDGGGEDHRSPLCAKHQLIHEIYKYKYTYTLIRKYTNTQIHKYKDHDGEREDHRSTLCAKTSTYSQNHHHLNYYCTISCQIESYLQEQI